MQVFAKARLHLRAAGLVGAAVLPFAAPVVAQTSDARPVDSALEMMNLKTEAGAMPDFVTQSRGSQAADDYIPIGAKPPGRSLKPKSAADVKAITAELDAARDAQLAGRHPKPMSNGTAASAKPARAAGKPLKPGSGTAQATNR